MNTKNAPFTRTGWKTLARNLPEVLKIFIQYIIHVQRYNKNPIHEKKRKNKPLQIGMVVEADILHERKKLYEWVLDPLYSISGKLKQ